MDFAYLPGKREFVMVELSPFLPCKHFVCHEFNRHCILHAYFVHAMQAQGLRASIGE
jgi:hypothetical protein